MADVDIARNEIADPEVAHRVVTELHQVAANASHLAHGILGCSVLDEGMHFEIEIEVPGGTERVSVPAPARPGSVRRAVAKVLRSYGLTDRTEPSTP